MIKILRTYDNKLLRRKLFTPKYGFLYNFPAVAYSTGGASIAPVGWHVPTNAECIALDTYIANNGNKLKEVGLTYWDSPNDGTNDYGFNARGSGESGITSGYDNLKLGFVMWTSTVHANPLYAYYADIVIGSGDFITGNVVDKRKGLSIRCIKNDSTNEGFVKDIDGNIYPTVKIGDQVWMAANLVTKRYNDGTPIPEITDGTEWSTNTTGARCSYDNNEANAGTWEGIRSVLRRITPDPNEYGLLYNAYVLSDSRQISSSDNWIPLSSSVFNSMCIAIGGYSVAGGKLKETGTLFWNSPNTGATNETGFNARGTGYRVASGGFSSLKTSSFIWTNTPYGGSSFIVANLQDNSANASAGTGSNYNNGNPIRLMNPSTLLSEGSKGIYIGNEGTVYGTKVINGVEYLTSNLCEKRFRNGEIIPWYGAIEADFFTSGEWAALSTAGCAAYNNDVANVGAGFSFPTV